ncbi:hypothetical protein NQD34_004604 [Periophthalmus magnuspinnatus]|nr:hypothetical protein NQD34_004604 [Periophthalmus magnuspinnatus]
MIEYAYNLYNKSLKHLSLCNDMKYNNKIILCHIVSVAKCVHLIFFILIAQVSISQDWHCQCQLSFCSPLCFRGRLKYDSMKKFTFMVYSQLFGFIFFFLPLLQCDVSQSERRGGNPLLNQM